MRRAALGLLLLAAGCSSTELRPSTRPTETAPGLATLVIRSTDWGSRAGCRNGGAEGLVVGVDGYYEGVALPGQDLVLHDLDPGPHIVRLSERRADPCWPKPVECTLTLTPDGGATLVIDGPQGVACPP